MAITPKYNDINKMFPDRAYRDPLSPSRETRTRDELLRELGPRTDIRAPEDQDMWEDDGGDGGVAVKKPSKPKKPSKRALPPVDTIYPIEQSTKSERAVKRPDKYSVFWGAGKETQSTRVWGLQWVPTSVSSSKSDKANVSGDIVAVFARPSKSQETSVYIYPNHELKDWKTLKNSDSFGRGIKLLRGGRKYSEDDASSHRDLHPGESDLFGDKLVELNSGRPGNESENYYLAVKDADRFKAGREGRKRSEEASKSRRKAERAEKAAKKRVISGTEEIAADLRSRIGQVYNPKDYE